MKIPKNLIILFAFVLAIPGLKAQNTDFRLPATPLVSSNPYFSIWSFSDHPGTDWYDTKTGKMVGFQARSVVGGVFIKMLQL
jgi:hypothetical protein